MITYSYSYSLLFLHAIIIFLTYLIYSFFHLFNILLSVIILILIYFIFRFNNDDVIGSCEIAMADVFETLNRKKIHGETEEYDFNLPIYSNGSANGRLQVRTRVYD